jgi:hypothetical protein
MERADFDMTRPGGLHTFKALRCTRCGETKPADDFHRNRHTLSGRSSWCKACAVARTRQWRAEIRDEYRRRNRERYHREKGPRP